MWPVEPVGEGWRPAQINRAEAGSRGSLATGRWRPLRADRPTIRGGQATTYADTRYARSRARPRPGARSTRSTRSRPGLAPSVALRATTPSAARTAACHCRSTQSNQARSRPTPKNAEMLCVSMRLAVRRASSTAREPTRLVPQAPSRPKQPGQQTERQGLRAHCYLEVEVVAGRGRDRGRGHRIRCRQEAARRWSGQSAAGQAESSPSTRDDGH